MANLPPIIPDATCDVHGQPVAVATPTLLRTAEQGSPNSFSSETAEVILNPAGADNDISIIANDPGDDGNLISIQITNAAATMLTSASVADAENAIAISPGSRARMIVTNAGSSIFNGTYRHAGDYPGTTRPYWAKINAGADQVTIAFPHPDNQTTGPWVFALNGVEYYASASTTYNRATQPESLTFFTGGPASGPAPVLAAAISDAAQIVNAIRLSQEASALVDATLLTAGLGSVAALSKTFLAGGDDGVVGSIPICIGQLCRVGPYPLDPPRTEEYDWFIAETMDYWRQIFI